MEELCGLKGCARGLQIAPKLPSEIKELSGQRLFRRAIIYFTIEQSSDVNAVEISLNKQSISGNILTNLQAGQHYNLQVKVPVTEADVIAGKNNPKEEEIQGGQWHD